MATINSLKFPSWLKHCIETKFYEERCERHVYIASWRASFEIGDLSQFWDASDIQVYRINFKQVVYLNPNEKGRVETNERTPKCGSCKRKLIESQYKFCSVACKMRSTVFSYRVRRRKARFPVRAPMSWLSDDSYSS
ncbi:uncharacterized protein [Henckelia pumila]|uniref:uncharacterized protein n=1 Tax=Henckelia pumila TaxID=405737 RepID=UPI003C6E87AF